MKTTILIVLVLALTVFVPLAAFADSRGDQGHNGHGHAWGHFYSNGARWGLNDHHVWTGCNSGNGKGNGSTGGGTGSTGGGDTGGSGDKPGKGGGEGTVGTPTK